MLFRVLLGIAVICISGIVYAQQEDIQNPCNAAEDAIKTINTWSELRKWEAKFSKCDDGGIAEEIGEIVENLLSSHWSALKQLGKEIQNHPEFEAQVFAHLGESISCGGCRFIVSKAELECPHNCESLCNKISQALRRYAALQCLPASLPWIKDQQTSILIPKIRRVIIRTHIDKSPALSPPFLSIENTEGKLLKRIDFVLEGVDSYHSILKFKVIHLSKEIAPLIIAVASSPGGSDIDFETATIGFVNGEILELTEHFESSSQDALCLEKGGTPHKFGLIFFNFILEEAHYDPHRYEATLYDWSGTQLEKINVKQTKKQYKNWKDAAVELGYHCQEDLIQTTNDMYSYFQFPNF
jgi:hypothetical protein